MGPVNLLGVAQPAATTESQNSRDPGKVAEAARQFEALLIGQMLKSMREGSKFMGSGDDQAGESMVDMADQQFAQLLAARGGLGLAQLISSGLADKPAEPAASAASPIGAGALSPPVVR